MVRVESSTYRVVAVIVAGGSGTRMGGGTPKQYLPLCGVPLLAWSVVAFQREDIVDEIVLVVPASDLAYVAQEIVDRFGCDKARRIVEGGASRQDSTACGIAGLSEHTRAERTVAIIHDGVRPFVRGEMIRQSALAAAESGAALIAVPVTDTIKRVDDDGRAVETVPRDSLRSAQTPQAFRLDLLQRALRCAEADGCAATDESMLVERLGIPVVVVPGDGENIKITQPEDMDRATVIAQRRDAPRPK